MNHEEKVALREAIVQVLRDEWQVATASQEQTQGAATHEESRAENDKDTRAIESSYLARGQARRVVELAEAVASVGALVLREFGPGQRAALSALVKVQEDSQTLLYFLAPAGGGLRVPWQGEQVSVLTPKSPLGRALLGQCTGDVAEVQTPQGLRELSVMSVS